MTLSRLAAVLVLLAVCPAHGSALGRNLLATHRAEQDASQMNAYSMSVMNTLQAASRELTDALTGAPPPVVASAVAKIGKVQTKFSVSEQHPNTTDTHLFAKQQGVALGGFSNLTAAKLREQQDSLAKLFEHLKTNIAKFNKREVDGKVDTEKSVKDMEERLVKDKERLKDTKLSAFQHELITNRTRTEEIELKYNKQGRQYQHSMFHANLKATHGLMTRVKGVLDAYGQALAHGRLDPAVKESMMKSLTSLPKALVQTRSHLRKERKLRRQGAMHF